MAIQLADQRPALTIALHRAKAENDPLLPKWEEELARMVAEMTRKFHGSLTMEAVRQGLETTIGILGLGLFHASEGAVDEALFLDRLRAVGVKGVCADGIGLIKTCAGLPETSYLSFPGDPPLFEENPRDLLLNVLRHGGYPTLIEKIARRRETRREIDLAHWMLTHSSVGRIIRRSRETTIGEMATAEDLFFYVLLRECGIPENRWPSEEEGEQAVYLSPKTRQSAQERYLDFVGKIPTPLQPALIYGGKGWFERFILPSKKKDRGGSVATPA